MNKSIILPKMENFNESALNIFRYQAMENTVYSKYLHYLGIEIELIEHIEDIPFLPIHFFKTNKVICKDLPIEKVFVSSGTSKNRSRHYVSDLSLYENSFLKNFEEQFGSLSELRILALLPSYRENNDSSLLYMTNHLINQSKENGSKYIQLNDMDLIPFLESLNKNPLQTILFGVSFALLELAKIEINLSTFIVMETGGMKGKRKEITREELHSILKSQFNTSHIYSEYGMCELLSQAYSKSKGVFTPAPWMKVLNRPINEPFSQQKVNTLGILKVIDLANINSCSFIETNDIGVVKESGLFTVEGRLDNSEIRGCNLLYG